MPTNSSYAISVPHLETERLTLREYRRADFAAFADHFANPAGAAPLTPAERDTAWRIFCSHAGLWLIDGAGWWAMEEKQTGQLVGTVGAFFREQSPVMELGWNTYSASRGQGFANEAATAVLQHAFEIRREPKVWALIAADNPSSIRVAQRLGLRYEGEAEVHGKAVGGYSRLRE